MKSDLHSAALHIQQPHDLKEAVKWLYHKYCTGDVTIAEEVDHNMLLEVDRWTDRQIRENSYEQDDVGTARMQMLPGAAVADVMWVPKHF
jgi:hypothetical protein